MFAFRSASRTATVYRSDAEDMQHVCPTKFIAYVALDLGRLLLQAALKLRENV
jgi:hypothetical protein